MSAESELTFELCFTYLTSTTAKQTDLGVIELKREAVYVVVLVRVACYIDAHRYSHRATTHIRECKSEILIDVISRSIVGPAGEISSEVTQLQCLGGRGVAEIRPRIGA